MNPCFFAGVLCGLLLLHPVYAGNTLPQLMQQIRSKEMVRIPYEEVRHLDLIDQPWRGSGFMYSMPPDTMILEQVQPEQILMGIRGDSLYYFDSGRGLRHQTILDEGNPLNLNLTVFKALINADLDLLSRLYEVDFSIQTIGWLITLKDINAPNSGFRIEISGELNKPLAAIKIHQIDGDFTEFKLKQKQTGAKISALLNGLYNELVGD